MLFYINTPPKLKYKQDITNKLIQTDYSLILFTSLKIVLH